MTTGTSLTLPGPSPPLIRWFPIVAIGGQVDHPGWRGPEAAGIEVERRQVFFEVDVQPLATSRLGVPDGLADQGSSNAPPLMPTGDLVIKQEGVIASVPRHVDKADQAATGQAGGHPAQAVGPDLIPPAGHSPAAMSGDKDHHLRIGHWPTPAVFNRRGHTSDRGARYRPRQQPAVAGCDPEHTRNGHR
jgi:hypothetical protein